jgi:hypothetical protein
MTTMRDRAVALGVVKAQWEAAQRGQLAIWTIYDRPRDHPDGFIARRFEAAAATMAATDDTLIGELEELRQIFWRAGLMKLSRQDGDEPQIVESWL